MQIFNQKFWDYMENQELSFSPEQKEFCSQKFSQFLALLMEKNEVLNLTALRSPEEAAWKHFADSLMVLKLENLGTLLDWGSGGGFPGLPLMIARNALGLKEEIFFLDSVGKKLKAVEEFVLALGLEGKFFHERGEAFLKRNDPSVDAVVMRAVAPPEKMIEWLSPAVSRWVVMGGPNQEEVWGRLEGRVRNRGFVFGKKIHYDLPESLGSRFLLELVKKRKK